MAELKESEQIKTIPGLGFIIGGTAACMAVTFTNPWEVVKTRLQLQGELMSKKNSPKIYHGILDAFIKIAKNEGLQGLQKGLIPAYCYQLAMNGVRFGGYEHVKKFVTSILAPDYYQTNRNHFPSNVLSGLISGVSGAAIGSPFFLVKTRLQSYSTVLAVGQQHHYKNTLDGLLQIYRKDGWAGIFSGTKAAVIRTGVGSSIQLATYDKARQFYIEHKIAPDNIFADFCASFTSGFLVCLGMNPFDVISTRIYNQKGQTYAGPFDCFKKTLASEGPFAFYKGFLAHYLRIGPHTIFCFVFLEQLRRTAKYYHIQ